LTLGTDGSLYGATYGLEYGGLFKITDRGSMTTLYTFAYQWEPVDAPIQGTDGNFYGTIVGPTTGTAYKVTPSGTLTFVDLPGSSNAPLVQGTDGNFYGTTSDGGANGSGAVFKVSPRGTVTTLYNFCSQSGCTDGSDPVAGLIQAEDGNFYGTTAEGGDLSCGAPYGCGTVFKITPQGMLTTLYSFLGGTDGSHAAVGLTQATDGNFYGTTLEGGSNTACYLGCGTIFEITPAGAYSILYNFDFTHGYGPQSTLMQHTNGKIYGTTSWGGERGRFQPGYGSWTVCQFRTPRGQGR
jgi:uncharacterized repeat protein (TIGR03803 family)